MTSSEIVTQTERQLSPVEELFKGIDERTPPALYEETGTGRSLTAWTVVHETHSYLICREDNGQLSRWWASDYRTWALPEDEKERIDMQIGLTHMSFEDYEGVKLYILALAFENHKVEQPTTVQARGIAAGRVKAKQELWRRNNIEIIAGILSWDPDRVARVGLEKLGPPVAVTAKSIYFLDTRQQRVNDLVIKYDEQTKQWFVARFEPGQRETIEYYNSISSAPTEHWVMCIGKAWQAATEDEVMASIQQSVRPTVEEEVA